MPHYRRPTVTGATIFFTVTLANRGSDDLVRHVDLLRKAVRTTKQERPFDIEAWVVLPDHLHCVWRLPAGDSDFSTRWRLIKSRFSRELPFGKIRQSHRRRNERGIWQRSFWEHHIRDEADLRVHLEYCWFNPVKHGVVADPTDWPFSSVHRDPKYLAKAVREITHSTPEFHP